MSTVTGRRATPDERLPDYVALVYGLVLVWGLGDLTSTLFATAAAGTASAEVNPWLRILLAHEPLLVVAVKAAVVLYAGVVLLACRPVVERVPFWRTWLAGIVTVGALVVANNTIVAISVAT